MQADCSWNVYTPTVSQKGSGNVVLRLLVDCWAARDLAWRLFCRDLSARYRQSLLGYFWAFAPSLLLAASLTLAARAAILNTADSIVAYPLFVLIGTVLWQTFAEAIVAPVQALTEAKPLLARIRFPYEAIILARLGEVIFNTALKLLLVAAALVYFGTPLTWWVLLAPAAILMLILLGTALGLFLAPIGGLYEDVSKGLVALLTVWFVATPVMYDRAAPGSIVDWVNYFNPVTPILVTARESFTTGVPSFGIEFVFVSGLTLVALTASWVFYRFSIPLVIERASS